jgi:DNA-binding transcriptional LysR family regulator
VFTVARQVALDDMALFVEVARAASFTRAGAVLGMPGATLSRRIAAMEQRLGVRLFDRTTRRVELTDAARRYLERCEHLVDEARLAQEALRETAERPVGHVRLSMPVDLGLHWIGPLLPEFARQHPGITLDIDLSARITDLLGEQVDLAFRLGPVKGERLIVRRIGSVAQAAYGAPGYLDRCGRPRQPADLAQHECLHLKSAAQSARWRFTRGAECVDVAVRGRFGLNNIGMLRLLAERGMGIALLAPELARASVIAGRLEPVLAGYAAPALPLQLVMASRLQPAAVKALVAFMANRLALN